MKAIINGKIILEQEIVENKALIFKEKIIAIEERGLENCEIIDAKGMYIAPGLIDIHIHGNMGADTMDATPQALFTISESIATHGVTSFLPTTMTMDKTHIQKALSCISQTKGKEKGATILGAHVEGPFINEKYKGAQASVHIMAPSYDLIEDYTHIISLITYAPELDQGYKFTEKIKSQTKIKLSMGHTAATYTQGKEAYEKGVTNVTHTFNGMSPFNHRDPGAVGAALTLPFFCEVIADNIHLNPVVYKFLLKNKGVDKIILITDSMSGGGMSQGEFFLGGQRVTIKDGAARIENGSLAGSVITLNRCLKNFYDHTDISIPDLFKLATVNPAKSLDIFKTKGSIAPQKDSDIAIFDEDFDCYHTFVNGIEKYNRY